MSRIAYVNGRYLPRAQAAVSIEDRGYNFADGVSEVCEVRGGRLIDERHLAGFFKRLADRGRRRRADKATAGVWTAQSHHAGRLDGDS